MRKNWLFRLDQALFEEITPGPVDMMIIGGVGLLVAGSRTLWRLICGRNRETARVYVDVRSRRIVRESCKNNSGGC